MNLWEKPWELALKKFSHLCLVKKRNDKSDGRPSEIVTCNASNEQSVKVGIEDTRAFGRREVSAIRCQSCILGL
jgi:hypothetical protein